MVRSDFISKFILMSLDVHRVEPCFSYSICRLHTERIVSITPAAQAALLPSEIELHADAFLARISASSDLPPSLKLKDQFIEFLMLSDVNERDAPPSVPASSRSPPAKRDLKATSTSDSQAKVGGTAAPVHRDSSARLILSVLSDESIRPLQTAQHGETNSKANSPPLAATTALPVLVPFSPTSSNNNGSEVAYQPDWDVTKKGRLTRASRRARTEEQQLRSFRVLAPGVGSDADFDSTSAIGEDNGHSLVEAAMRLQEDLRATTGSESSVADTDIKLTLDTEHQMVERTAAVASAGSVKAASNPSSQRTTDKSHFPQMSMEMYQISVPYRLKPNAEVDALPEPQRTEQMIEDQEFLEQLALESAISQYSKVTEQMFSMGKGSDLRPEQRIVSSWFAPLAAGIKQDMANLDRDEPINSSISALRVLQRIEIPKLAVMTLQALLNTLLSMKETVLLRTVDVCMSLVESLKAELYSEILRAEQQAKGVKSNGMSALNLKKLMRYKKTEMALSEDDLEREELRPTVLLRAAAHLVHRAIALSTIPTVRPDGTTTMQAAFRLRIMISVYPARIGVVQPHPGLIDLLRRSHVSAAGLGLKTLPMVVPPKDWSFVNRGAYLTQRQCVMRTHGHRSQMDVLRPADLARVYEGLNCLNSVRWKINTRILDVIRHFYDEGVGFGEIPSLRDADIPLRAEPNELSQHFYKRRSRLIVQNRNLHSLRMSCKYRIEVAEMFRERSFYLPHSLDFRGRAYPLPPHLNQMGSDATRGLLLFDASRPLGPRGLYWLKIHLANLYGMDKLDFEGRAAWVDKNMENIEESANAPLHGRRWWQAADKPFECLAACHDIVGALKLADPSQYLSCLPTHQDGSCNGLQHYAALGRDEWGGMQVNLIDSEKPQDVYSGVCSVVQQKLKADAEQGDELAKLLLGKVERKTVKQTVMTSVYGVTFIGAREQIANRLKERKDIVWPEPVEQSINKASIYIAKLTFESLGDVFKGAWAIMEWLTQCAQLISSTGVAVSWLTPLGLPVIQPYRSTKTYQVSTALQKITLVDHSDLLPVSKSKQRSAFPPNFVHSLDSSHMFMTAIECRLRHGLDFAAVHDSYWTHAGSLDTMNESLRTQFIALHSGPLLEELRESFVLRFPNIRFPELPARGKLDLKHVMQSKFFFD